MSSASEFVTLKAGLSVPMAPLLLALDLEARGFVLAADGDELIVRGRAPLSADDCAQIRRWKAHLLALVDYHPPEVS